MKVYEKLGINPTTQEGIKALLEFTCKNMPEQFKNNCDDYEVPCGECIYNYLMS